jgi:hypothetical protein
MYHRRVRQQRGSRPRNALAQGRNLAQSFDAPTPSERGAHQRCCPPQDNTNIVIRDCRRQLGRGGVRAASQSSSCAIHRSRGREGQCATVAANSRHAASAAEARVRAIKSERMEGK